MDRAQFSAELGGIQMLLREHEYLAYAPSRSREYEQKVRSCADQFAYLVFRKTGIPVKALTGLVPIESVRDPTYAAGRAMAQRAAKRALAIAKKNKGLNRDYFEKCAALWLRAWEKMGEPD
jgi:hypothetical protein